VIFMQFALDMPKTCLLVIDMQHDFVDPKGYFALKQGWPVGIFAEVAQNIRLLKAAVKTKGGRVIYTATGYSPDGSDAYTNRHSILPAIFIEPNGYPRPHNSAAIKGTWGADIIDGLLPDGEDYLVHKRRFDAFYQTELEHMLRCWGVTTLIVTGVTTEVCVETTVREAFVRDFDVLVASDGVGTWHKDRHEASLRAMDFSFARVAPTEDLLKSIGGL
jgi:ureidoacrylate peracid hydrolase